MAPTRRDIGFCLVSIALGVWTQFVLSNVTGQYFAPILTACQHHPDMTITDFSRTTGYHEYDTKFGFRAFNILVCFVTQFLHDLVNADAAGSLVWMTNLVVSLPVAVLTCIESGRRDAWGPIRYPVVLGLLYQFFGISVVFPLIWIPSYILGRGTGGVSPTRVLASVPMTFPTVILSALVFWLDTESDLWTSCAAILGGPTIVLTGIFLWFVTDPDPKNEAAAKISAEMSTKAYAFAGILSIFVWLWMMFISTIPTFGLNLLKIYNTVWGKAVPAVQFMTIDALVLWLSTLLLIGYQKDRAALDGFLVSFLFGPGGGTALMFASLQVDDEEELRKILRAEALKQDEGQESKKDK